MYKTMNVQQIDELFQSQVLGRIGCIDEGVVYVVPVSYVYEDNCIYAHSQEGLKIKIMRKSPSVCFQVDDSKDLSKWSSAIGWGSFTEITDPTERLEAFKKLNSRKLPHVISETMHINELWPFADKASVPEGVFFKIKLERKTGKCEQAAEDYYFAT